MRKNLSIAAMLVLVVSALNLSGCKRGEDDPFLPLRSRDARLTQSWNLVSMEGSVVTTTDGSKTNIQYNFDGKNLYVTTDDSTTSSPYSYTMDIKNDGSVISEETFTDIITNNVVSQSSKTSFWYWGNDDKNKTSVNLDLTGILADYPAYDIPRLANSDMTLSVDYSDNYTTVVDETTVAGSETVSLTLKFELQ